MTLDLDALHAFGERLQIPSRDEGLIPFRHSYGTQRALDHAVAKGLEEGVHHFVVLKGGRQLGFTTWADRLTLYYLPTHEGMIGMYTMDSDDNRDYRRDVLLQMHESLPRSYRRQVRVNNRGQLVWMPATPEHGNTYSRLIFAAAGKRMGSNLGRSRGLNYRIDDEVGSWPDQGAIESLNAAFSKRHPARLRISGSTARGFGPFKAMWDEAEDALTVRRVFIAWWMREDYAISEESARAWERYAAPPPTQEEREWIREVRKRYAHTITPGQLGWYRMTLAEEFLNDQPMMDQEFGSLPEHCFVAFGDKLIPPAMVRRLERALAEAPEPAGYRYEWKSTFDQSQIRKAAGHQAPLRVWEPPDPEGVYVVAGHPAWSSAPNATEFVAQVWRIWPDEIRQVAEYAADSGAMHQFAWTLLHLAGAYVGRVPPYVILETSATGYRVSEEIQLLQQHGYGLSLAARTAPFGSILGNIQRYFYWRPDSLARGGLTIDWKTSPDLLVWILHGLRDTIERGHMRVRSSALVAELAGLRRGGPGASNDELRGQAIGMARAVCAALAVECWLRMALGDLTRMIAPVKPPPNAPTHVGHAVLQSFLSRLRRVS